MVKDETHGEEDDVTMNSVKDEIPPYEELAPHVAIPPPYAVYYNADQINYIPEEAFKEGLNLVRPLLFPFLAAKIGYSPFLHR